MSPEAPPPSGAGLDLRQQETLAQLLRRMQQKRFDRGLLQPAQQEMAQHLAAGFGEGEGERALVEELDAWVRWYRLPGFWLTYLFQLVTQARCSPYHPLACALYSDAQAAFNSDLAFPSMQNALRAAAGLRAAGGEGLEGVERALRSRLEGYYAFFRGLTRPRDYMAVNPLVCHLHTPVVRRRFREAFPEIGSLTAPESEPAIADAVARCDTPGGLYYRVLGRRFLALHREAAGDWAAAAEAYRAALDEAVPARLETEIGHLYRHLAAALMELGRHDEAATHLERACAYERPADCSYWYALSAYELGDARVRAGVTSVEDRPDGSVVEVSPDEDREALEHAHEAYRSGLTLFEAGLPSPVPIARAVKQQLFRSFHENALNVARLLGDTRAVLTHLEAGGPRLATELVAEIEVARAGAPEAAAELRRTRALVHASLGTVPERFEDYLEASEAANEEAQRYMRSYLALSPRIGRAQMSEEVVDRFLQVRSPDTVALLFNVGWHDCSITLVDLGQGRVLASALGRFGYQDLDGAHERYRADVREAHAQVSPPRRDALFRAALDRLLEAYQAWLGPPLEGFLPALRGRHVKIFPRAHLNAVPLGALRVGEDYLVRHCTVSYAPSLGLFLALREREAARAVSNEVWTVYDERLPFYEGVIGALDDRGPDHHLLRRPSFEALVEATREGAGGDLLFACHGTFDADDPGRSRLHVGGEDGTSLWDVLGDLDLSGCGSVVLGACESGLTRSAMDAEYVGFPGVFHAAGVDHVVGTLWKVNQLATAVLLRRYFEQAAAGVPSRAGALRAAQLELMAMSRDELTMWVERYCPSLSEATLRGIRAAIARFDERPFAHPAWWSGFYLSGP